MSSQFLPAVARPPHDPLTMVLDGRLGWRGQDLAGLSASVEISADNASLTLAALETSGRVLSEPSGSFGGLVLPRHVALLPDGRLAFLNTHDGRLYVFDGCTCSFVAYPCVQPGDPRVPAGSASIAVAGEELLICVPSANRVIALNAATGAARAVWLPPPVAADRAVRTPWTPVACVELPHRIVAVADPANGGVHLCSRRGRSLRFIGGMGAVQALAADRTGHLYVRRDGESHVLVVDIATGNVVGNAFRPAQISAGFRPAPVRVYSDGAIDVGPLCEPPASTPVVIAPDGTLLPPDHADATPLYPTSGTWLTLPLDSEIDDCVWDQVALTAALPACSSIEISTRTSNSLLTEDELLDPQHWRAAGVWKAPEPVACTTLEYMLRSSPGRYLWLKLALRGTSHETPCVARVSFCFPRISLRRYLPAVFGSEPIGAEFTDRWLAIFDRGLRDIEAQVDTQARLFDPMSAPASPEVPASKDFLRFLAQWVGVTFASTWSLARRRRFLKLAPRLYPWRGTLGGLRAALHLFLGLDRFIDWTPAQAGCVPCVTREHRGSRLARCWQPPRLLLEHYQLRRWMTLGHARLSDAAKLWGERIVNRSRLESNVDLTRTGRSDGAQLGVTQLKTSQDPARDPFHLYAHKLSAFVPAALVRDPAVARALEQFIEAEKPAHVEAHLVLVEPRFRVGVQAMLGLDAVIGVRTAPVTLDEARLGRATVLAGAGSQTPQPARVVGTTRIGMNTVVH